MEEEKLAAYEELKAENMEIKYVLNKLTHEMGNALTILGASMYNIERSIQNENINVNLNDLKNDYIYICSLFKELREYNSTDDIVKREITVEEIVKDIEDLAYKLQNNTDIKFNIFRQENTLTRKVYGDIIKLRQVFVNIIKNSVEAVEENETEKGKNIFIGINGENSNKQILDDKDASKKCEMIHIEVVDNGKGILKDNLDKIFESMYTYGKKDGTGLGLAIVKKIIDNHNGKIKAVSVLGTGTALHIYLPIIK